MYQAGLNGPENDYRTETPKASGVYGRTKPVLRKGDDGDAVICMQVRLWAYGYLPKTEVDGVFGKITLGAVLAFQLESGLEPDGICGPLTNAALFG